MSQKRIKGGLFITFEGGEGAGKTTLIDKVEENLKKRDFFLLRTREPGGTKIGEEIRKLLLYHAKDKLFSSRMELCLFLSARAQHVEEVLLPALSKGKIILCDRFSDSTVAYQGIARKLGQKKIKDFCSFVTQDLWPDITFYLDIPPKIGLKRINAKEKKRFQKKGLDRIESEKIAFHEKIRKGFHKIAKKEKKRFYIINSKLSPENVFYQVKEILDKFLKK